MKSSEVVAKKYVFIMLRNGVKIHEEYQQKSSSLVKLLVYHLKSFIFIVLTTDAEL